MKRTVKIIVSGDGGVGKTSFLNRLIHDKFDTNSKLTKGIDFFSKEIQINGFEYNFIMWDFAGQNQFKRLLSDFVDGSLAAFVLFDLSRFKTLENVEEWIKKLSDYGDIPAFILGNKNDQINYDNHKYFDDYVLELTRKYNNIIGYLRISSKTGYNVKKAFDEFIEKLSNY
ncbi:MAG: Rab family GTPase [Promethearchaeota archaeon]